MESIDSGGPGGNRTPDALLRTEALYPLSYEAGTELSLPGGGWWEKTMDNCIYGRAGERYDLNLNENLPRRRFRRHATEPTLRRMQEWSLRFES